MRGPEVDGAEVDGREGAENEEVNMLQILALRGL
jgi:hypothetical protein